jgi:predicted ABC-type ATPase
VGSIPSTRTNDLQHLGARPNVFVVAGPNGAGKTTFATEFLPHYADCRNFINADLIASGLSPFAPASAAFRAGRLMLKEIKAYVERNESFGFETTLSGQGYSPCSAI